MAGPGCCGRHGDQPGDGRCGTVVADGRARRGAPADANTWIVEPGQLRLKPAKSTNFEGASVADGWPPRRPWLTGGDANDGGGFSTINGAHVAAAPVSGGIVEFRATFANAASQHAGFGDFTDGPWAMFSTGSGSIGRALRPHPDPGRGGRGPADRGVNPEIAHTYRIEWTAADVKFYVDGPSGTPPRARSRARCARGQATRSSMRPALKVDWIGVTPYPASGTTSLVCSRQATRGRSGSRSRPQRAPDHVRDAHRQEATPDDGTWSGSGRSAPATRSEPAAAQHPVPRDADSASDSRSRRCSTRSR